jgi:uncharacterized integral membrane protein
VSNGNGATRRSITAKQVIVGILILVVVVLAIANSREVKVDFVVADVRLPLFVVIVGSALIGWVIGFFTGRHRVD